MGLLIVMKEPEVVLIRKAIFNKYGFEPSEEYCKDLIAFIEALNLPNEEVEDVKGS